MKRKQSIEIYNKKQFEVYTDGSSFHGDKKGGWAFVVSLSEKIIFEASGFERNTTNNRMELIASLYAMTWFKEEDIDSSAIFLFTDSKYVSDGLTLWAPRWKKNSWKNRGEVIRNVDIWKEALSIYQELEKKNSIRVNWIKGHSGVSLNEHADELCGQRRKDGQKIIINDFR